MLKNYKKLCTFAQFLSLVFSVFIVKDGEKRQFW